MNQLHRVAPTARVEPAELIRDALSRHDRVAISFSGAEDVVLIDMAAEIGADFSVVTLDTGRLHPETYGFLERVRQFYGIDLDVLLPDRAAVDRLVREKGLFSFYRDGHTECCSVRKIEPLRRYLAEVDAWITGQRRDQGVTRVALPQVQEDEAFSEAGHRLLKYNPLADWSSADVWQYIRDRKVPYNPLHDRGFASIGCEPCTRAIGPHQQERDGRWWWEEALRKECGLHAGNVDA